MQQSPLPECFLWGSGLARKVAGILEREFRGQEGMGNPCLEFLSCKDSQPLCAGAVSSRLWRPSGPTFSSDTVGQCFSTGRGLPAESPQDMEAPGREQ